MRASKFWLGLWVASLALGGCLRLGSDDSRPTPTQPDAHIGTGGSGPFPFDSGFFPSFDASGGFSSDGGRVDAFIPGCGFCPPFDETAFPLPIPDLIQQCCTSEGQCGHMASLLTLECLPRDAPGFPDPMCPAGTGPIALPSCCTFEGWCGVQVDQLGLGCVRRSHFAGSPILITDPTDLPCFSTQDNDAGTDHAALLCEHAVTTGRCDPLATCTMEGGALQCVCPSGYADLSQGGQGIGQVCRDINECLGARVCPEGRCVNTPGSYRCEASAP